MKKSPLNIVGIKNPLNNYKEGYYGVSRRKSPLNDMTEQENAAHHANLSVKAKSYRPTNFETKTSNRNLNSFC